MASTTSSLALHDFSPCISQVSGAEEKHVDSSFSLIAKEAAIGRISSFWPRYGTLTVKFTCGTVEYRNAVQLVVAEWQAACAIRFRFVGSSENADIRISFEVGPSQSYIGTGTCARHRARTLSLSSCIDALQVPQSKPTMNIGLDPSTPRGRATVLHEFGHALGFGHEHQSFNAKFEWDKEVVVADMARYMTREQVDINILRQVSQSTNHGISIGSHAHCCGCRSLVMEILRPPLTLIPL
jgi:hypothetical protein